MKIKMSDIDFEKSCEGYLPELKENKEMTKSLKEKGQISPIIFYKQNDNKCVIIDGMSRYISAKILGWTELEASHA